MAETVTQDSAPQASVPQKSRPTAGRSRGFGGSPRSRVVGLYVPLYPPGEWHALPSSEAAPANGADFTWLLTSPVSRGFTATPKRLDRCCCLVASWRETCGKCKSLGLVAKRGLVIGIDDVSGDRTECMPAPTMMDQRALAHQLGSDASQLLP